MINYDAFLSRAGASMQESAIRQMGTVLAKSKDMISFAPGYPAEDQFPWPPLTEIARELLTGSDGSVLQYGPTRGYRPLREATIALMAQRGIKSDVDRVVITTGSQQGLDLVARVLLDPGDVALMELPSYTGAITAFRNVGASLVGVRQDADGLDFDDLERTWAGLIAAGRRVKLLYLVPNFQNPTGLLLGAAKRTQALEWAERRDVLVVEDDPYRDLYFGDASTADLTRPIAAGDDPGRVVYLSSFSKTLAPGFRVGWLSAPPAIAGKIEFAKQAGDLCTSVLDQRIVHEAWKRGLIDKHLPALRAHYQNKCDTMTSAIARHMPGRVRWTAPRGGFFLWAALTGGFTSQDVMPHAQGRGVIFVNGSAFFVDGSGGEYMRLSFSAPSPARIEEGIARLGAAIDAAAVVHDPK
ncbi:MAG TPA: PLP-dependent aminotransferase family protein [Vicinamibacterales bacterium]|nr:PLP-dependent aminotransferase family protein [Vicinamibacterales bacterium]